MSRMGSPMAPRVQGQKEGHLKAPWDSTSRKAMGMGEGQPAPPGESDRKKGLPLGGKSWSSDSSGKCWKLEDGRSEVERG